MQEEKRNVCPPLRLPLIYENLNFWFTCERAKIKGSVFFSLLANRKLVLKIHPVDSLKKNGLASIENCSTGLLAWGSMLKNSTLIYCRLKQEFYKLNLP